ncbi:hypothetical protein PR048_032696 [Dryococelus australis]|uniref:Uncharacterized protein n=1 Tax=Dryococelus australis TaxID=614101 RepID=A0ABQ9G2Y3_9NEOP|nr:hypothetical protein PR048_032696 [Dryococelus australis]
MLRFAFAGFRVVDEPVLHAVDMHKLLEENTVASINDAWRCVVVALKRLWLNGRPYLKSMVHESSRLLLAREWLECTLFSWAAQWLLAPAACTDNVKAVHDKPFINNESYSSLVACTSSATQFHDLVPSRPAVCNLQPQANRVRLPAGSYAGIVPDDATGRRVFSGISRFPHPSTPTLLHTHLASSSSALKIWLSRAAQIYSHIYSNYLFYEGDQVTLQDSAEKLQYAANRFR